LNTYFWVILVFVTRLKFQWNYCQLLLQNRNKIDRSSPFAVGRNLPCAPIIMLRNKPLYVLAPFNIKVCTIRMVHTFLNSSYDENNWMSHWQKMKTLNAQKLKILALGTWNFWQILRRGSLKLHKNILWRQFSSLITFLLAFLNFLTSTLLHFMYLCMFVCNFK
jgi:hypothetical protein